MHPCLYVDEIVREIAQELVAVKAKGSAAALACCCRSLESVVLDTLWARQSRLNPLLKILLGDGWNSGRTKVSMVEIIIALSFFNHTV